MCVSVSNLFLVYCSIFCLNVGGYGLGTKTASTPRFLNASLVRTGEEQTRP